MRITTVIIVLVSLLTFISLLAATAGLSVMFAAKTSFEKANWNLKGMDLYALEYGEKDNTMRVSLGIKAEVRNSNTTRTKLPFKFTGGKFSAWVDSQLLGDGVLKEKSIQLRDSFTEVELELDQPALPQGQSKGLTSFIEGNSVNLKVKLRNLKLWGISLPINKEFSTDLKNNNNN